jgi:signal transduction histidine kinase
MLTYLAIRAVHVGQAVICVALGWSRYRRPKLAATAMVVCGVESAWVARRCLSAGGSDPSVAAVDVATGLVGLVAMSAATGPEDRTTSMNWMLPYSVGAGAGISLSLGASPQAFGAVGALSVTYLASALTDAAVRSDHRTTAIANAASYVGFYGVAETVVGSMRRASHAVEEARRQAAERGEQLAVEKERVAVERERNHQHRLIHDSALQTLEVVAGGLGADAAGVQARARVEASRLRRVLAGADADHTSLDRCLAMLVEEFAEQGLVCERTTSATVDPPPPALHALVEATREALRNVVKHTEATTAVIRAVDRDNGVQVTVRDHGQGFDPDAATSGFGLRQSVIGRLADVHGTAEVWSRPGRGARVTM